MEQDPQGAGWDPCPPGGAGRIRGQGRPLGAPLRPEPYLQEGGLRPAALWGADGGACVRLGAGARRERARAKAKGEQPRAALRGRGHGAAQRWGATSQCRGHSLQGQPVPTVGGHVLPSAEPTRRRCEAGTSAVPAGELGDSALLSAFGQSAPFRSGRGRARLDKLAATGCPQL